MDENGGKLPNWGENGGKRQTKKKIVASGCPWSDSVLHVPLKLQQFVW